MACAEGTKVTVDASRAEIERTLRRYGAAGFGYAWQGDVTMLEFVMRDRRVRYLVVVRR